MKNEVAKLIESALAVQKHDVDCSFPSIFSREDVKHLLEEFGYGLITNVMEMKEEKRTMSLEGVEELSQLLIKTINNKIDRLDSNEVVDYDSACFTINYDNRVELESIDFMNSEISNVVEEGIDEALHDFFSPEEEEVVSETPYATEQ